MGKAILAKQLQKCLRNLHSFTDGQVQMVECDWEQLSYIIIEVSPNDGIYKGNRYKFKIEFTDHYPVHAPTILCLTNIYHPNIELASNSELNEATVCVSLMDEWSTSNTVEDTIMSILFLLYNPNLDDPLSRQRGGGTMEGLQKTQEDIMKGQMEELMAKSNLIDSETFETAKEAYNGLLQCEWDVLAEAANVAWEHTLEQEKWAKEMKRAEDEMRDINWERHKPRGKVVSVQERRNYAFGRSALQRNNTVSVACGQASSLDFVAPHKDAILAWRQEEAFKKISHKTEEAEQDEEPMDCTGVTDTSPVFAQTPASTSWQPLCETEKFKPPSLRKTFTCSGLGNSQLFRL